ncbi:hypothetical protein JNB11_08685 [Kocuria palustris]|nr:hypothetical protein [Kocuria palustris]
MSDDDDSFITQFETTLTIKPLNNYFEHIEQFPEDDEEEDDGDISLHTVLTYNNYLKIDIDALEEEEVLSEQIPKFNKLRRRLLMLPTHTAAIAEGDETEEEPQPARRSGKAHVPPIQVDPRFQDILKPSPLIDYLLSHFNKAFGTFLQLNPHILSELPRFGHEWDKTIIVLSPYSAEHAFGRKWVTKLYLSTIFERPQRLLALLIGVAAAVTMFPFYYKLINLSKRGSIFSEHVLKVHGKNWPRKLFELCIDSHDKLQNNELEVPEDWNTGDIYVNPRTINAIEGVIGTIETTMDRLYERKDGHNHNLAFSMIRPPGHHSHACLPLGFCLLNNVHIGIEYAHATYGVTHCAILDFDLHHGDGSQDICWEKAGFFGDYGQLAEDEIDDLPKRDQFGKRPLRAPKVGYFSLHDIKLYPTELGYATKDNIRNALTCIMDHDLAIWNVHLQEWSSEDDFYKTYATKYVQILNRANQFLNQAKKQYDADYEAYLKARSKFERNVSAPGHLRHSSQDLAEKKKPTAPPPFKPLIIISAGFDALEYENPGMQRHGINVPTSFFAHFTYDVVKLAKLHAGCKVASFLEGGYSDGALTTGLFSHLIGLNNDDELLWNSSWGSEQVMKELVKGCKKTWSPYKRPQQDITIWANEVIKLGRLMMPNAVLPASYVYQYQDPHEKPRPRMVKELAMRNLANITNQVDPNDARIMVRQTRSYMKKMSGNNRR